MATLTVNLADSDHTALKVIAARRGTSAARIVRDLIAGELAATDACEPGAATWTPATARTVLGIDDETDPIVRATVAAAMIAAERQADAIYGASCGSGSRGVHA